MTSILRQIQDGITFYETKYGEKPISILIPPIPYFKLRQELADGIGSIKGDVLSVFGIPVRVVELTALTTNFEVSGRVWRELYGMHGFIEAILKR